MEPFPSFQQQIDEWKSLTGKLQAELAGRLEVSATYLSQIYNGRREPSAKLTRKMAEILERSRSQEPSRDSGKEPSVLALAPPLPLPDDIPLAPPQLVMAPELKEHIMSITLQMTKSVTVIERVADDVRPAFERQITETRSVVEALDSQVSRIKRWQWSILLALLVLIMLGGVVAFATRWRWNVKPPVVETVLVDDFSEAPDLTKAKPFYRPTKLKGGFRDLISQDPAPLIEKQWTPDGPAKRLLSVRQVSADQCQIRIESIKPAPPPKETLHAFCGFWFSVPAGEGKLKEVIVKISSFELSNQNHPMSPRFVIELKQAGVKMPYRREELWSREFTEVAGPHEFHYPVETDADISSVSLVFEKALPGDAVTFDSISFRFERRSAPEGD